MKNEELRLVGVSLPVIGKVNQPTPSVADGDSSPAGEGALNPVSQAGLSQSRTTDNPAVRSRIKALLAGGDGFVGMAPQGTDGWGG